MVKGVRGFMKQFDRASKAEAKPEACAPEAGRSPAVWTDVQAEGEVDAAGAEASDAEEAVLDLRGDYMDLVS